MNIIQVFKQFPTKERCIAHLEKVRWQGKPICPYCQSIRTTPLKQDLRHHCNACNTHFSVIVNTLFHDSRLPLQKWFLAISLILNAKKGISSRQLARDLEVNKDTAWSMQMRIRQALLDDGKWMTGIVEMDETYVGGKPRPSAKEDSEDKPKRGRGTQKTPVIGIVEREGKVCAQKCDKLSFSTLKSFFDKDAKSSHLMTDEFRGYLPFAKLLTHQTVNHALKQYAQGEVHTNTIESFWALFKRGVMGQYHKVSKRYLDAYLQEFCFKYNHRKSQMNEVFGLVVAHMLGV